MKLLSLALILALLCCQTALVAAEIHIIRVRWADLGGLVTGKKVSVRTTAGEVYKGQVQTVESDAIVIDGRKGTSIKPASIAEIRLTEYVGNGRRIGKMIGGATGLTFGLIGATAIGLKEGSGRSTADKAMVGLLGVGGLPLGMIAGYFLGRQADKEVTVIQIIPGTY